MMEGSSARHPLIFLLSRVFLRTTTLSPLYNATLQGQSTDQRREIHAQGQSTACLAYDKVVVRARGTANEARLSRRQSLPAEILSCLTIRIHTFGLCIRIRVW